MSMKWPKDLIHGIACRRCVLFFGAGVSMNSVGSDGVTRPPSWAGFLGSATDQLTEPHQKKVAREIKRLISKSDLLTAAEVIKNEMGREAFVNLMKDSFHVPDFQSAPIHDLLFGLDLRISISPNFDNIYETSVAKRGAGAITVKKYYDDDIADSLRRHERVLIKSHGSISNANKLIFTRTDYAKEALNNSLSRAKVVQSSGEFRAPRFFDRIRRSGTPKRPFQATCAADFRPQDGTWVCAVPRNLRARIRLAKPNSVNNWALFFARPR